MDIIKLNRKQLEQLCEIAQYFKDVDQFVLESSSPSGIGNSIHVKFDLFETSPTKIDITDVSEW